jgi:hypothetical protein
VTWSKFEPETISLGLKKVTVIKVWEKYLKEMLALFHLIEWNKACEEERRAREDRRTEKGSINMNEKVKKPWGDES